MQTDQVGRTLHNRQELIDTGVISCPGIGDKLVAQAVIAAATSDRNPRAADIREKMKGLNGREDERSARQVV